MGFSLIEKSQRCLSGGLTTGLSLSMSDSSAGMLSSVKKPHPSPGGLREKFNQNRLSGARKDCLRKHSVSEAKHDPSYNRKGAQLLNIRQLTEFDRRGREGMSLKVTFRSSVEGRHEFRVAECLNARLGGRLQLSRGTK